MMSLTSDDPGESIRLVFVSRPDQQVPPAQDREVPPAPGRQVATRSELPGELNGIMMRMEVSPYVPGGKSRGFGTSGICLYSKLVL